MDKHLIPVHQLVQLVDNGYAIHEVNQCATCTQVVATTTSDTLTLSLSNAQLGLFTADFLVMLAEGSQQPVDNTAYCLCTYAQPYCRHNEHRRPGLQCPFCAATQVAD